MAELTFTVFGHAKPWQRRATRRGVSFTPKETRQWESTVRDVASASCIAHRWERIEPPAKCRVRLEVAYTDRRVRDLDNVSKAILDGITKSGAVWKDDSQVWDLHITRVVEEAPRVTIRVEGMEASDGR